MFGLGGPGYSQALNAATTASNVGAGYGTNAATASSQLMPFLTRELNNPQGFTQQQIGAQLGASEAGAGGATSGIATMADLASARNRNSGGFSGALDAAAREKGRTLAGNSEHIAANNANLQQQQQQAAARGLMGEQGMDQNAQLRAMGLVPQDINAATRAYGTGDWASSLARGLGAINSVGKTLAGVPGLTGWGG